MSKKTIDPILFEVVQNKLQAIATEQSITLKSVSGSPVVTESSDFGNALCLPDGSVVVRGQQLIPHASSINFMVRSIIQECRQNPGFKPGDMFFLNDPWRGALHQSDVGIVAPVFYRGKLIGWSGTVAHQLDVGGMMPGSWCPTATEKFQEGISFPPVKLVERGAVRSDIWNLILSQSRIPFLIGLDLKGLIASNNVGVRRWLELIERYGLKTVRGVMERLIDLAEEKLRARLLELPDGVFRAVDFLDHDGHQNRLYRISLELTKRGDTLTFDFSGSSPQSPGFINGTEATLWGGILSPLYINLAYDLPWNGGLQKPIKVVAPRGTICNAEPPAPVSGAPTAVMRIVHNICTMALSRLLACTDSYKQEAKGITCGTFVNLMLSGRDQYGQIYGTMFLDPMIGGEGAYDRRDGIDTQGAAQMPTPNIANVESIENVVPVLYLNRGILPDSGGAGKYRGGNTGGLSFVIHDVPAQTGVLIGHGAEVPNAAGIYGGIPGSCYYSRLARQSRILEKFKQGQIPASLEQAGGQLADLGAKPGRIQLGPAEVFEYTWQGGGGWGDPLQRDPQKVLQDVLDGYVTPEWALRLYGVIVDTAAQRIDETGTEKARREAKQKRLAAGAEGRSGTLRVPGEAVESNRSEGRSGTLRVPGEAVESRRGEAIEARCTCTLTAQLTGPEAARVMPLGEYLELSRFGGETRVICRCGHQFCPPDQNWKEFSIVQKPAPEALGPLIRLHKELEIRLYICPACATLLSTEVCLIGEADLFDTVIEDSSGTARRAE